MYYTSQGAMTPEDLSDMRDLYDLNPEPITLGDLARELNATTHEVYDFGGLTDPYSVDLLIDADSANAIREAWDEDAHTITPRITTADGAREVLDAGGEVRRDERYSGDYRYIVTREPGALC